MADNNDISFRVTVVNPQGQSLGGAVDLEYQPQGEGQPLLVKGADASKDIDVSGLERSPRGLYQLTITPSDVFKPVSQFVNISARGFAKATALIDKATAQTPQGGPNTLAGNLVFDNGLPATGVTARLYDIGTPPNQTKAISLNLNYWHQSGVVSGPATTVSPAGAFSTHTVIFTVTFGFRRPPGLY